MKPEQLELITTLSAPALSPDGERVVVAARRPSFAADAYVGQLWEMDPEDGRAPRRITQGFLDTRPRFSPDGATLGFLRRDAKGRMQFAVIDPLGGEGRILTDAPLGVLDFVWDRQSQRVALTLPVPEEGRYGTLDGVDAAHEDPRRITRRQHKLNGRGYITDKPIGVAVLRLPPLGEEPWVEPVGRAGRDSDPEPPGVLGGRHGTPHAVLVTPRGVDASEPEFSPDGAWLYFTAALHEERDSDLRTMVHRVSLGGPLGTQPEPGVLTPEEASSLSVPDPEVVATSATRAYGGPRFSADGRTLFLLGSDLGETGRDFVARLAGVFALPAEAVGTPATPAELTDRELVGYDPEVGLVAHGDSAVVAVARVRGAAELHSVPREGKVRTIVGGQRVVTGASSAGRTLVVTFSDPTTPGEVGLVERINGAGVIRALTTFATALNEHTRVVVPRELSVKSADGYPVHGWVFLPEGAGPHPVLLNIHGGPFAEYGWNWFDEAQVLTGAGYAVVQCNPRGSASYGREHGLAIRGRLGSLDLDDVLAFLSGAVKAEKALDPNRLGILGGSYGGYLTAWTIAHDHRFAAAVVERGFLDPAAFDGTSDIGWFFGQEYLGTDAGAVAAQSPMTFAGQTATPTLVVHSEQDLRCPIEQAQRYHARLRDAGVETEMVVFPGENHELSRSGTPWHRRQRFEIILEWFERHLPV